MKHYLIYKVTNLVNEKIYIGKHITENINDGYLGSGKILKRAISKYGLDKFQKDILYDFDNDKQMVEMESEIVDEDFLDRTDVYNIRPGGIGGFTKEERCEYACGLGGKANSLKRKNDPNHDRKWRGNISKSLIEGYASGKIKPHSSKAFLGKHHTEETKKKIGSKNSVLQKGNSNSHYGHKWIHNQKIKKSVSIKREETKKYIKEGWILGRKMFFE